MQSKLFRHVAFFTLLILIISLIVITFGHLLNGVLTMHAFFPRFFILFCFIAGAFTYFLYKQNQEKITHELAKLYSPKLQNINIPIIHVPLIICTTLASHLFGASVGREGVAVQIGGTIGTFFARRKQHFSITTPARVIITTGMATGFAALFGMPLTAAFFAIEITQLYKKMAAKWLVIPFVGSFTASQLSEKLGLTHIHFTLLDIPFSFTTLFALLVLLATLCVSITFYLLLHHHLAPFLKQHVPDGLIRITVGAIILSCLLFFFQLDAIKGLGSTLITQSFILPNSIHFSYPILKILFTISFLAIGFKGGEVTPVFAIGAMIGAIIATAFHLPVPIFAIIGLAAFFAGTTKTYIAPLFLAAEITALSIIPLVIPFLVVIYFVTPKIGIYHTKTKKLDYSIE